MKYLFSVEKCNLIRHPKIFLRKCIFKGSLSWDMIESVEGILIKAVIKRELIFMGVNNALGEPNAPEIALAEEE